MQDLFNKIVSREISAHIIWENETHLAFLDIKPIQPGHTLVIPKTQNNTPTPDYIFEMPNTDYSSLMLAAKEVANILKDKLDCKRVGVVVEGFLIPHVHIHLVPLEKGNELNPDNAKPSIKEELNLIRDKILS